MRIKLTIQYDGTSYCGWQRQKNGVSVQETIENAVEKLCGKKASVTGSGRTDSGVHAKGQVAHVDVDGNIPPERLYLALNTLLPDDIKILSSRQVDESFHSRFSAKKKTYVYRFYVSEVILPLKDRYAVKISAAPDIEAMRRVGKVFCGEHDFAAFRGTGSEVKDTVRTIYRLSVEKTDGGLEISVTGNGFLYNMVRVMAGTMLAAGYNELTGTDVENALKTGKRDKLFKTMPAKGLTLESVEYDI